MTGIRLQIMTGVGENGAYLVSQDYPYEISDCSHMSVCKIKKFVKERLVEQVFWGGVHRGD
jgi:hypothetical protein